MIAELQQPAHAVLRTGLLYVAASQRRTGSRLRGQSVVPESEQREFLFDGADAKHG